MSVCGRYIGGRTIHAVDNMVFFAPKTGKIAHTIRKKSEISGRFFEKIWKTKKFFRWKLFEKPFFVWEIEKIINTINGINVNSQIIRQLQEKKVFTKKQ